ncbi:hypothetical protein CC86DRAFT_293264 [Ophiobolus disseminans]|uniref:F-box domain-containing protein n=1 Tax=Ophiobolus disseminans TaxID=1469910 RepID=A0A6A6ZYE5_9PLEO|nr:hypothetical protein CC86DRAFT_293264 [Ophiobolus disseminans]
MDIQPHDQLDRLPTELKCIVARLLTALDNRKSLVLVNKAWAAVGLPFRWETFTTDLVHSNPRSLLGLGHPNSSIVKHVRNINLLARASSSNVDYLLTLLAKILRGQLHGFKSKETIQASTLSLLLVLHPALEVLHVPGGAMLGDTLQSPWTSDCFSNLTSMDIYTQCFSGKDLSRIATSCPKLEQLSLDLYSLVPGNVDAPNYDIIGRAPNSTQAPSEFEVALNAIASMPNLHTLRITNP